MKLLSTPKESRCGQTKYIVDKCWVRNFDDGTMLHTVEEIEEVKYEINNKVITEMTSKHGDLCYHNHALKFIQPDIGSLLD